MGLARRKDIPKTQVDTGVGEDAGISADPGLSPALKDDIDP